MVLWSSFSYIKEFTSTVRFSCYLFLIKDLMFPIRKVTTDVKHITQLLQDAYIEFWSLILNWSFQMSMQHCTPYS